MCRNHSSHVKALLACSRLGVDVVLLSTRLTAQQLEEIGSRSSIDTLICDAEFMARAQRISDLIIDSSFDELPAQGSSAKLPRRRTGALVLLTSGSTGPAKMIRRKPTLEQLLRTCAFLLEQLQVRMGTETMLTVPFFHGYGLAALGLGLVTGSPLHVRPRADAATWLRCIETERIHTVLLVPTILYRLLERTALEPFDTTSIKTIISGSAPLDSSLATRALQKLGDVLHNLYGSSEAGLIALATPQDLRDAPSCVGRLLPGVRVVAHEHRHLAMPIRIDSDLALQQGINTGDVGYFDDHDRLHLLGRQDDLIICGGEKIYPETLEREINQLEGVIECAIHAIPDTEFGQALELFIVLQFEANLEPLQLELQKRWPRALRPKRITRVLELPRNAIGKLQRDQLPALEPTEFVNLTA
jgi:acyl-CoA synthetase (AMP-forming)/AMP-acid ligase II